MSIFHVAVASISDEKCRKIGFQDVAKAGLKFGDEGAFFAVVCCSETKADISHWQK